MIETIIVSQWFHKVRYFYSLKLPEIVIKILHLRLWQKKSFLGVENIEMIPET